MIFAGDIWPLLRHTTTSPAAVQQAAVSMSISRFA
jgi:hypothetical protein